MTDTKKRLTLEEREVVLVKVESMMAKGTQKIGDIAREVGCSIPTAKEYMDAIRTRWEEMDGRDFTGMRAELLAKSKELEAGYWKEIERGDNSSARVGALNGILEVQKHQAFLVGIKKIMESQ